MKNDTTFVRMRSDDHLGDAKMSKKDNRSVEFDFFINCDTIAKDTHVFFLLLVT